MPTKVTAWSFFFSVAHFFLSCLKSLRSLIIWLLYVPFCILLRTSVMVIVATGVIPFAFLNSDTGLLKMDAVVFFDVIFLTILSFFILLTITVGNSRCDLSPKATGVNPLGFPKVCKRRSTWLKLERLFCFISSYTQKKGKLPPADTLNTRSLCCKA